MLVMPPTTVQALSRVSAITHRDASSSSESWGWFVLIVGVLGTLPTPTAAESTVILESQIELESFAATTFDKQGHAIGTSSFEITTKETGVHRMIVTMAIEGGGRNVSEAMLAPNVAAITGARSENETVQPIGPSQSFQLLQQRVQATRADGDVLELLVIDHMKGRVSCYPPNRGLTNGQHIDLPEDDRVVNVPLQLLFLPLVSGEVDSVRFQVALCRDGPVIHKMIAVRGPKSRQLGRDVLEIRYGPDLGSTIARGVRDLFHGDSPKSDEDLPQGGAGAVPPRRRRCPRAPRRGRPDRRCRRRAALRSDPAHTRHRHLEYDP